MKIAIMKKIMNLALLSAVALVGFSSCRDDVNEYDPEYVRKLYTEAFTERYGEVGTDNSWGFENMEPLPLPDEAAEAKTRAINPNGNQWEEFINVPATVTEAEAKYVANYFATLDASAESVTMNLTDFFVLQVWKGTDTYVAGNGATVKGSDHMDQLIVGEDHIYNFNGGINPTYDGKMLIQNGSTDTFGYNNSLDGKKHYEYIAQRIDVPGVGEGYYVAFDYCATGSNPNQQVEADGKYTDGIVKIVPGEYKNAKRIMCEDLGTIGDFDFNDVVFDVYINYNEWWHGNDFGIITLRAAGGTLPLYVAGKEVHEAFGVSTTTMVNTGKGPQLQPVSWRFVPKSATPKDVEILVKNTEKAIEYTLTAEKGKVPYMIAVPTNVAWSPELQSIEQTYPKFPEWVKDNNVPFWE